MACPDLVQFAQDLFKFKEITTIDKKKDRNLRFNVWGITPDYVINMIKNKSVDGLSDGDKSRHVVSKIVNSLIRATNPNHPAKQFQKDIMSDRDIIAHSIALHEVMESVKGESDKARNNNIELSSVTNDGILPVLPLSRVAASIGRKILFQKGYRFKTVERSTGSAQRIEELYYKIGKGVLEDLQDKKYIKIHEGVNSIKDYIDESDMFKEYPEKKKTTTKSLTLSLNAKTLGIKPNSEEAKYFTKRTAAKIEDTEFGVITELLRAVSQVTQKATITVPETKKGLTLEQLAEYDAPGMTLDKKTAKVRKKFFDTPIYVHSAIHDLMNLLKDEVDKTGNAASTILSERFGKEEGAVNSLLGLKYSDDYSVDKKENIRGQNLSKTTPLDDLADSYGLLIDEQGNRSPLHMILRLGRNGRLYYDNSVLNPHGSKQSRYMLTPGEQTIEHNSEDFDYLVYGIGQALDKKLTHGEIVSGGNIKLDKALEMYNKYSTATNLKTKLIQLRNISTLFEGTDYVTVLTTLQAVNDVRNPVNGIVTTEFTVSADATASGGTLTFLQALGTEDNVINFMERIGLFHPKSIEKSDLDDLYGLMSEAISGSIEKSKDRGKADTLMQDTLDLLFNEGKDVRELSKDPTMTFVYGQGKTGAVTTMSQKLANRIIDNLDDPKVKEYLAKLFDDETYRTISSEVLRNQEDFYKKITKQFIKEKKLPGKLYDLMYIAINEEFLEDYGKRSNAVFDLAKKVPSHIQMKILPAAAVMSGDTDIKKYGIPITKLYEVSHQMEGGPDTVLTRKEKLMKSVMDVSTTHGIDAAQLYHSLADTMGDTGVVVVHDDVRGDVKTVRAMEKSYAKNTVDIISKYDVHQQVLASIAFYAPELVQTAEYKKLKIQIDTEVAAKKKLITENFNPNNSALIGDGNKFKDFAGKTAEPKPKEQPKVKVESEIEEKAELAKKVEVSTKPTTDQDFKGKTVKVTEDGESVEVLAQYYWEDLSDRLDMVEKLKKCQS